MSTKLKSLDCLQVFSKFHLSHIGYLNVSRARKSLTSFLGSEIFFNSSANTQQEADRDEQMFWFVLVSQFHSGISQLFSVCRCWSFLSSSISYSSSHTALPDLSPDSETPRFAHKKDMVFAISELGNNTYVSLSLYMIMASKPSCNSKHQVFSSLSKLAGLIMLLLETCKHFSSGQPCV